MTPPDNPGGQYVPDKNPSPQRRAEMIVELDAFPAKLRSLVAGLTTSQLDTKYKNWTIRQIVHHFADSHANGYIRTKLALTEENPTVKPYDETKWSALPDARQGDVEVSLCLLEAVHTRWVATLRAMTDPDFERTYFHPEHGRTFSVAEVVGMYSWHCRHHGEMIAWLRKNRFQN